MKDENINIDTLITDIDDLVYMSRFINYNNLDKDKKKIRKYIKKMQKYAKDGKFDKLLTEGTTDE